MQYRWETTFLTAYTNKRASIRQAADILGFLANIQILKLLFFVATNAWPKSGSLILSIATNSRNQTGRRNEQAEQLTIFQEEISCRKHKTRLKSLITLKFVFSYLLCGLFFKASK